MHARLVLRGRRLGNDLRYPDMAVQTFRHAAKLSPSGHRPLDRLLAMLAMLYNAALEERIHAWRMSGRSISPYDRCADRDPETGSRVAGDTGSGGALGAGSPGPGDAGVLFAVEVEQETGVPAISGPELVPLFRIDHPQSARCALRTRDEGRRGELRRKGLPRIRFAIRRPLPPLDRLRGFRVVRKARPVEVQLLFEPVLPAVRTDTPGRPVGLDAGIRGFATPSDGGRVERQRKPAVRTVLRRIQRAVSRSRRGSKSRGTKKAALARAHEREAVSGRRELHRIADRIMKVYDLFAVEALQIRNMTRRGKNKRGQNRAIAEQGWGEFVDIPRCRAARAGIPFVEVPPAGRSQDCSRCGIQVPNVLSERVHRCGECGLVLDRDGNAARNVLSRGLRIFTDSVAAGGTA